MKKADVVKLKLNERSYDIVVGAGAFNAKNKVLKPVGSKKAVLISDERLVKQRKNVVETLTSLGWTVHEISVIAGESFKDFERIYSIYGELLKAKIDRHSTLFALGGGSVGDAAGFIASTYLRGIRWVGLPTTLLSQVDSAIGGKTGVNHREGKNLIGSFFQPAAVICDLDFLKTLSKREVVSGLGEIVKYGLVFDKKFFEYCVKNWRGALSSDEKILQTLVKKSVQWKAKKVAVDEFDRKGVREALNFGHTFAHALETQSDYRVYQHGEAVIWGMRYALALSVIRQHLNKKSWQVVDQFLATIEVPELLKNVSFETYRDIMLKDKKVINGKIRFVLIKNIGHVVLDHNVDEKAMREAYELISNEGLSYGR
ncbi:MAG: 3-dehydroquinate synthase [Bdellovibrionota bacterium]